MDMSGDTFYLFRLQRQYVLEAVVRENSLIPGFRHLDQRIDNDLGVVTVIDQLGSKIGAYTAGAD